MAEEGGGRVRGHPHGPRPEQDRPHRPGRDEHVRGGAGGGGREDETLQNFSQGRS